MRKLTVALLALLCGCASTPQKPAAELGYRDCADKLNLWNPLSVVDAAACTADMHRAPQRPAVTPAADTQPLAE